MNARHMLLLLAAAVSLAVVGATQSAGAADPTAARCRLGVYWAFAGRLGQAETLFTAMLSSAPQDARALTNLGNLRLLAGDTTTALGFYQAAQQRDTTDAGIVLNHAITLHLMERHQEGQQLVDRGRWMAGGPKQAAALLGKPIDRPRLPADLAPVVGERWRRLVLATRRVNHQLSDFRRAPADTSKRVTGATAAADRSSGDVRAELVGEENPAAALYWKY